MDEAGWHARRRADEYYSHIPDRNPDGSYIPRVTVAPLNDAPLVGGTVPPSALSAEYPEYSFSYHPTPTVPIGTFAPPSGPPPPAFPQPSSSPPSFHLHVSQPSVGHNPTYHAAPWEPDGNYRTYSEAYRTPQLGLPSARDQANSYAAITRMDPHLQLLCGPLLKYDTVVDGIWYGACMIVTADAGSVYDPHPVLTLEWDPYRPVENRTSSFSLQRSLSVLSTSGTSRGGYSASPIPISPSSTPGLYTPSPHIQNRTIYAQELWVYPGPPGSCTFWRWMIQIPLGPKEMGVRYRINGGRGIEFFVPGLDQNMRFAATSCNGFSAGVNQEDFRGPGHANGFDPLWTDMMAKHAEKPFHALVGGGDQLYCDAIMREPELQEFVALKSSKHKLSYNVSDAVRSAVDRFYFSHYCLCFRNGVFAKANSQIPMVNMLDDHDIIDGFGSYPEDLQTSPLFSLIGSRGYFYFLLFQQFIVDSVDGTDPNPGMHNNHSIIIGGPGAWIPFPSHSFLTYMGPNTYVLLLDCRAERKIERVCSEETYEIVFERLWKLPQTVHHLVIQLDRHSYRIKAYPRMNFMETALESPLNPFIALGRANKLGMGSLVNKFNLDAELLVHLNDHWTSKSHKKERNRFIQQLQTLAMLKRLRITFLSGDVHCAAVGLLKTLSPGGRDVDPTLDYRYMLNVVSSGIVNTPPPAGVQKLVAILSERPHKSMHYCQTDEVMVPLFKYDTKGQPLNNKNILGRRNYCMIHYDEDSMSLVFDIRVEKEKGIGTTVSYPVSAPPPLWHQ